MTAFCWLPPLRFTIGVRAEGVAMDSRPMSRCAALRTRPGRTVGPELTAENFESTRFSSTPSSGTTPSSLRSSGVMPTPRRFITVGVGRTTSVPSTLIVPAEAGSNPAIARRTSVRPEPISPPMPSTSSG